MTLPPPGDSDGVGTNPTWPSTPLPPPPTAPSSAPAGPSFGVPTLPTAPVAPDSDNVGAAQRETLHPRPTSLGVIDPASYSTALTHAQPRWHKPARILVVLGVVAIVVLALGAFVRGFQRASEERRAETQLPAVVDVPPSRSTQFTEITRTPDGETSTNVYIVDTVDGFIDVSTDSPDLISYLANSTHYFAQDEDGTWLRFVNTLDDTAGNEAVFGIADRLTIDELVPVSSRPWATVVDRRSETIADTSTERFELMVDIGRMQAADPAALAELRVFWTDLESGPDFSVVRIVVWVDDAGTVYQVESTSDFDDSLYRLTIDRRGNEPFVPDFPTDFIDVG